MKDASELYGLPLDRFVAQRAALVKALRSAGKREEAARVAKLAKPTVGAWVVNQLVRTQQGAVARLFEAGDALKRAQSDAVAGRGGGAELREASVVKRHALVELVEAARGLLDAQGHGPSELTLTRVSATLDAAALEEGAREQVREGCLTRELQHVGLGEALAGSVPAAPPRAKGKRQPAASPERPRATAHEREIETAAERELNLQRARKAEEHRREIAERAMRELEQAQARRDRAARELDEARQRVAAAEQALIVAEHALSQASARAEQAVSASLPGSSAKH